jgi:hypothetical protein
MKTLLTAIAVLCILASTATASPFSNSIPLAQNAIGIVTTQPNNYAISYDSSFGGHWNLTGKRHVNHREGTYTDSFRGTVSDTFIEGTFTRNDFEWLSDWWWISRHDYKQCLSFSMTISDGSVTGFATYAP